MTPLSRETQGILEEQQRFVASFLGTSPRLYIPPIREFQRSSEYDGSFGNIGNSATYEKFLPFEETKEREENVPNLEERLEKNAAAAFAQQQSLTSIRPSFWTNPPSRECSYAISKVSLAFGNYLIGATNAKGNPDYQEDRFFADQITFLQGSNKMQIPVVGVCDGHAGFYAAQHVSKTFTRIFIQVLDSLSESGIWRALKSTCEALHQQISDRGDRSGTTLTVALVFSDRVWVANVGDSRALLLSGGGVRQLTEDMELTISRYRNKILANGGTITKSSGEDGERVNESINMARTLGDSHLNGIIGRRPKITALPFSDGDTLMLLTDGVTWAATPEEINAFASKYRNSDSATLCEGIVRKALEVDPHDNITALALRHLPPKKEELATI